MALRPHHVCNTPILNSLVAGAWLAVSMPMLLGSFYSGQGLDVRYSPRILLSASASSCALVSSSGVYHDSRVVPKSTAEERPFVQFMMMLTVHWAWPQTLERSGTVKVNPLITCKGMVE